MDVQVWTAHDWMNRGSELLDASLACQKTSGTGLQIDPSEAIAWFNLESAAPAAPDCCSRVPIALPSPAAQQETEQAARNNLSQDLLCSADGSMDGIITPSVLTANQETIPYLKVPSALVTEVP